VFDEFEAERDREADFGARVNFIQDLLHLLSIEGRGLPSVR
jgi:hypothetical protein